jgi:ABC-type enterochelin transport system substrate-binding protein
MNLSEFISGAESRDKRNVFKHVLMRDVAIDILSYSVKDTGDISLEVAWLNVVNPQNIFVIDCENILIKKEQVNNWNKVYTSDL